MSLLFIVISISFSDMWSVSRLFVLSFIFILMFSEIFLISVFNFIFKLKKVESLDQDEYEKKIIENYFYIKWFLPGGISLILIYIFVNILKDGSFEYNLFQEHNFILLISSWGLSTLLTNRYKSPFTKNHIYEIAPYLKAAILSILFINFFYFSLRIDYISIKQLVQVIFIHSTIEIIIFFLYFFGRDKLERNIEFNSMHIQEINSNQERLKSNSQKSIELNSYSKEDLIKSLGHIRRKNISEVISFIWSSIKSEKINKDKISIFNTKSTSNIKFLSNNSKNLIINIHKTNDIRRINEYFLDVYSKLENDGLFIGNFIPLENMSNHLRSRMPHFLYFILIPFYFIFFRVFPKLTITKQIYFILTRGKNRVLSKAEVLGRLSFCGYEVVDEKIIGYTVYFISRKIKTISKEKFPSYGPIVKLKRVGYQGKRVYIYKFRTMYPYSEFIQGHIYKKYDLDKSGKFKNDFRITSWGKVFRSYFIDEIPQLYNWLIGDIKLIGVRALSEHYFGLYPQDIQELRVQSKPGIIPPYYADMPNSFEEIIISEKDYLIKKKHRPIITDVIYFSKAIYNIVFSGARSK
tara:strand:- start:1336 stop:3069 length:1734 start_codon:yes stop_codon:yes gene_type:complete